MTYLQYKACFRIPAIACIPHASVLTQAWKQAQSQQITHSGLPLSLYTQDICTGHQSQENTQGQLEL